MRTGSTSTTYFDPFTGPCNTSPSWWASQKPYKDPTAIKVSTNTTDIVLPGCPTTETPNEATSFNIPFQGAGLAPGYAKFYVFLRDEQNGLTGNMSILNPNGTTHTSWSFTSTGNYNASFWGFSKKLPTTTGKFTFQTVYNGKTCFTAFDIVNITGAKNQVSDKKIQIFPNPTNGKVFIKPLNPQVYAIDVTVYNAIGLTIETFSLDKQTSEFSFSLEGQPRGFYFINFNDGYINTTGKILLQ
jgi:hypothetical protein